LAASDKDLEWAHHVLIHFSQTLAMMLRKSPGRDRLYEELFNAGVAGKAGRSGGAKKDGTVFEEI